MVLLLVLAGCGADAGGEDGGGAAPVTDTPTTGTAPSSRAPSSTAPSTTESPSTTTEPPPSTSTTVTGSTTTSATASTVDPACILVADLDDPDELARWRIVNDGVMGGRSSAEAVVADSVLTLTGEIVTDGGGFSSVRLDLAEPLGPITRLIVRLRTDGRPYELTMADVAAGRDRRVSHQSPIDGGTGDDWVEAVVEIDRLETSIFGRPVEVEPFEPEAAVEVGIILADGVDGPFRLELDWIRACP